MYSTISSCRLCKSTPLVDLFSLGDHKVNAFPETSDYEGVVCPIAVVECKNCTLVQLKHSVDPEILYQTYWYKSGVNEVIKNDLKEIAEVAMRYMGIHDAILDIGANDGTLLSFVSPQYHREAVEPSLSFMVELAEHANQVHRMLFEEFTKDLKYKVITAIGMFYDSEDPLKFVKNVTEHLSPDGVFIAQMMAAKQMYEQRDIGNLCHEHLEFYTYTSLVYLFEQAGLEIFKVEENTINGGSYRIFARHYETGSINVEEPEYDWKKFKEDIEENKRNLNEYLDAIVGGKRKIYGYGASTKGNTMLQFFGFKDGVLRGIADRSVQKHGRFSVTGVPVVSEQEAREGADYFLVFPYGFIEAFKEREKEWLEKGGTFIVPLPEYYATR